MAKRKSGNEAADFLSALYRTDDSDGYVELRVRRGGEIVHREFATTMERVQDVAVSHGSRLGGGDVYFGVGKRATKRNGRKENVSTVPALWCDIDIEKWSAQGWTFEATVRALYELPGMLQPSALVHSGGGLHAYWFLDAPADMSDAKSLERFEATNKVFQQHMASDMVWDCSRVLRLPGTFNARAKQDCRTLWCFHWHRHALIDLADTLCEFNLYLGPNGFVEKDELPKHPLTGLDAGRAFSLNYGENARGTAQGWRQRYEALWAQTAYHGQPPYIGIDEAQLRATAYLWSFETVSDDHIVKSVLRETRRIKERDAPGEAWNWDREAADIAAKLERWKPRWELLRKRRDAEKKQEAKRKKQDAAQNGDDAGENDRSGARAAGRSCGRGSSVRGGRRQSAHV